MSEIKAGNTVKLTDRWTYTGKVWLDKYPYPSVGSVGKVAFIDEFYWCTFAGYPDGDKNLWPAHGHELEIVRPNETLEERYSNIATSVTPAPTDDIAALQAENARLQSRIEAMTEMHKHTEGVYDMQYRLERENSMMLFHALGKVAPDTLKGLKLNHSNTELDKVYLEYSRRLERLSIALVNVRDAETLEECADIARKALQGGE